MRRPMFLFATLILTLASVGVIAWGIQPMRPVSRASTPTASEGTARLFYDAANRVIATGDLAALRAVVAPSFVDIEPLPGTTSGRIGLERTLLDLHVTMPGIQLEIEELLADGPEVMARIAVVGDRSRSRSVLGIPVAAGPEPWGRVDSLLIVGGHVTERRASVHGTGQLHALSSVALPAADLKRLVVTLDRVGLQPGVGFDVVAGEHAQMLVAESAGIQIESRPVNVGAPASTPGERDAGVVTTLLPDVPHIVPAGAIYTIMNRTREAVSVLRLTMERPAAGGPAMGLPSVDVEGVTIRAVAGGNATILPSGSLRAGFGRIVLAPGGELSLDRFDGVVLVGVEAGRLSVSADGDAFKRWGDDGLGTVIGLSRLDTGDGMLVGSGTPLMLRNDGTVPSEALMVTVTTDAPRAIG